MNEPNTNPSDSDSDANTLDEAPSVGPRDAPEAGGPGDSLTRFVDKLEAATTRGQVVDALEAGPVDVDAAQLEHELDRTDRADRAADQDPTHHGFPGHPTEEEVDAALDRMPDEILERMRQLENAGLGTVRGKGWLGAYEQKIQVPEEGTCAACGAEVRSHVFDVDPWGEVLELLACECRILTRWTGPHEVDCPICRLMQAPNLEVLHTHREPCLRYIGTDLEDSYTVTWRWYGDETDMPGALATNTVPDELDQEA